MYYGPLNDAVHGTELRYYSGNWPEITNAYDMATNEISASYILFSTSYIPFEGAPTDHLPFEIEVSSRFDASLTKVLRPDFRFSYPGDVDTTLPIIKQMEGEGCDNIGQRALNCPTDGKYEDNSTVRDARVTLYGEQFPSTTKDEVNTTVVVTIDGVDCPNTEWVTEENRNGYRTVSCEFGSGVSAHGVNGWGQVQLSYFTNTESKVSKAVRFFSYAPPSITGIEGCPTNVSALHTANCIRTGYQQDFLIISGTNFGKTGARVFIGGVEVHEDLVAQPGDNRLLKTLKTFDCSFLH